MFITVSRVNSSIRTHWFFLAAAAVVTGDFAVASLDSWSNPALLEAGILVDLSIVVPALYLWCYRTRGKAAVIRALALSCLGIWVAGHVVPNEHHQVLSTVGFFRYVGLAVLILLELKLVLMIYRTAFRSDKNAARTMLATAKDAGMPHWAARLMAWEASWWRKAWDAVRQILGRS